MTANRKPIVLPTTDLGFEECPTGDTLLPGCLPAATTAVQGAMSASDKSKLDGIASGATANSSDTVLLARANHTGTQTASTISDFTEAAQDAIGASLDGTLSYTDVSNSIGRAAISGDVTIAAGSNVAAITSDSIVDADINSAAAIALSKLALLVGYTSGAGTISAADSILSAIQKLNGNDAANFASAVARANHTGTQLSTTISDFTEAAQDAVGGAVDSTLVYNDAGNSIGRAAISGDVTIAAGSNTAAIGTGVIVDADVNASAAIALSKLGLLVGYTSGAGTISAADSVLSAIQKLNGNIAAIASGGRQLSVTLKTTGTSHVVSASTNAVRVFVIGGGGAGGGSAATSAVQSAVGAGGGSGAVVDTGLVTVTPSASLACTIGAGGVGASGANGGAGGSSTITIGVTTYTAAGGSGGTALAAGTTVAYVAGAQAGSGTNGLFATGGNGGMAIRSSGAIAISGAGGECHYGTAGRGNAASSNGFAATGFGSGGGGAVNIAANVARTGGNGAAGALLIVEYS